MPDLETFFDFGGTLELVTAADSELAMRDIVISEIMWAVDRGIDNEPGTSGISVPNPNFDPDLPRTDGPPVVLGTGTNLMYIVIRVPQLLNQEGQWIELYNSSLTQAVNLNGWELQIRNLHDAEDPYIDGRITFKEGTVLPNQTFLICIKKAATNIPENRIYDIYVQHRHDLNMTRSYLLLNPKGFYLKLTDKGDPNLQGDDEVIDEVGNLSTRGARTTAWELPPTHPEQRRSIVRVYGTLFTPEQNGIDEEPDPPEDGRTAEAWRLFSEDGSSPNYYGARDDLANPGYRKGGPVPVELAGFRPVRAENGAVVIKWWTESELNNAGFNILRSESRDGDFKVINVKGLIPGYGTSSEQHLYTYTDTTAKPNVIYYYRIEDVSFDGARQTLATVRLKGEMSAAGKLTTTWSRLKARD